jgi:hypothetical protein
MYCVEVNAGSRRPAAGGIASRRELAQFATEIGSVHQLHREPVDVAVATDRMDVDDVGVAQATGGARLFLESRRAIGLRERMHRQHLESDLAPELLVPRLEHDAHAATTETPLDPEVAEHPPDPGVDLRRRQRPRARGAAAESVGLAPRPQPFEHEFDQVDLVSDGAGEEQRPLVGSEQLRALEQRLDARIALRRHRRFRHIHGGCDSVPDPLLPSKWRKSERAACGDTVARARDPASPPTDEIPDARTPHPTARKPTARHITSRFRTGAHDVR